MRFDNPFDPATVKVRFQLKVSSSTYSTRVIQLKSLFESLAEIMGFLAGFAFLSRLIKHILIEYKAGSSQEAKYLKYLERVERKKEVVHAGIKSAVRVTPMRSPIKQRLNSDPVSVQDNS